MKDNVIFVHIPKTGGTTINTAYAGTYIDNEPNFNYRHYGKKTGKSNAGDIFSPVNFEKYKDYIIYMMVRHPVDRVVSQYYFYHHRSTIVARIKGKPKTFEAFVKAPQTQNGMVTFLKGRDTFSRLIAKQKDLDDILEMIDRIPIHVGIFEQFNASMAYFSKVTEIEWAKEVMVKRMTLKRPKVDELSEDLRASILKHNDLDLQLYNHCLEKFNQLDIDTKKTSIKFDKNKYHSIIQFATIYCVFEYFLKDRNFLMQQSTFLRNLNFYILNNLGVKDGEQFLKIWNQSFLKTVNTQLSFSDFEKYMNDAFLYSDVPIERLEHLANAIDLYHKDFIVRRREKYPKLAFDPSLVVIPPPEKKGLLGQFKNIFGSKKS